MGRDYFLDKDALVDKQGNIYFVFTNYNPPGYLFAYLKYVYTSRGLWKGYERVLPYYGVKRLIKLPQRFDYEPCYGVTYPVVYLSEVKEHLRPEEGLEKIVRESPKVKATEALIDFIYAHDIDVRNAGVTGSLLLGIAHENSDVDLVIYGDKSSEDFLHSFPGFQRDDDWILETSRNYGLSLEVAKRLYNNKTRGIYKGVKFSVLFVNEKPRRYCEMVCRQAGEIETKGTIYGDVKALYYPSSAVLQAEKEYEVISFEGIFSSVMYGARKVSVKGALMQCDDKEVIVVGDRRVGGYVAPDM